LPFQNLKNMSTEEKQTWSEACEAPFPCVAEHRIDDCETSLPCPDGWGLVFGYCRAGPNYGGPCRPVMAAESIEVIGKKTFMDVCAAPWTCRAKSKLDYTSARAKESEVAGPIDGEGKIRLVRQSV